MRKFTTLLTAAAGTIIILTAGVLLSCGEGSKDVGPAPGLTESGNDYNPFYFQGFINDRATGWRIVGARVDLWAGGVFLGTTYTNEYGGYHFELGPEWNMTTFTVVSSKEGYGDAVTTFSYYIEPEPTRWHDKDMVPAEPGNGAGGFGNPNPENPLYQVFEGYINDSRTGHPVGQVKLTWVDLNTHETLGVTYSAGDGYYMSSWIGEGRNRHWIRVTAEKQGYLTKVLDHIYYTDPTWKRHWEFDLDPLV